MTQQKTLEDWFINVKALFSGDCYLLLKLEEAEGVDFRVHLMAIASSMDGLSFMTKDTTFIPGTG